MFVDGRTLWVSWWQYGLLQYPPISCLRQGRYLRGKLPFLPSHIVTQFVPAAFVFDQLQRRQAVASFQQGACPDVRGSALIVGQHVRVIISGLWLPGAVQSACSELDFYIVRLTNGRVFRCTHHDINVDNSGSTGFGIVRPLVHSLALPLFPHVNEAKYVFSLLWSVRWVR